MEINRFVPTSNTIIAALVFVCLISCSRTGRELNSALRYAGDNRPELEAVLEHYRDDPEKLAAARFLITNMPAHRSYRGDEIHEYYDIALKVLASGLSPVEQRDSLLRLCDERYPNLQQNTVSDIRVVKADFLIRSIDQAFTEWRTRPWAQHVTFDEFCEWLLPYKAVEFQEMDSWRDTLSTFFTWGLNNMVHDDDTYETTINAVNTIRNEINWRVKPFGVYNRKGYPLLSATTLPHQTFGSCLDYVTLAVLTYRSVGIPCVIDDDLYEIDGYNHFEKSGDLFDGISYNKFIYVDLNETANVSKRNKEALDIALKRISANIRVVDGKMSLSHVTASSINIEENFFDAVKALIDSCDVVPDIQYTSPYRANLRNAGNLELYYWEQYWLVYGICLGAMSSSIERKCFNQYWFARGDLSLTPEEWNGGIIQHIESMLANGLSLSNAHHHDSGYYTNPVSFANASDYNFCFGSGANITFTSNNSYAYPVGFYDPYDFNPQEWGIRDTLAEIATRIVHILGPINGARDYIIRYGISFPD